MSIHQRGRALERHACAQQRRTLRRNSPRLTMTRDSPEENRGKAVRARGTERSSDAFDYLFFAAAAF
jgi:hypothetical protein